jgi:hypothetical protein
VTRSSRTGATLLVVATLCALAACGKRETPAPERAPEEARVEPPPAAEPPFQPIGTWAVVGHHVPGISTMTDDEAAAHDGQTVRLATSEALSNGERCAAPTYPARTVGTEDFLATEFNLPPESLKPVEKRAALTVVQVDCDDTAWTAFGSLLIAIGPDRALTPWDGVFFELERVAAPPG